MAATHQWSESNTVSETVTDGITNLNFGNVDDANLASPDNRVIAGNNSYEKYIRCKFTGTWTEISNMKFWKSVGAYVTGEDIKAAANTDFATPTTSISTVATVTIPTTEGTALSINSYEDASTIVYGGTGVSGYTDYITLQLQTTGSTPPGALNQKTFSFQYDEV